MKIQKHERHHFLWMVSFFFFIFFFMAIFRSYVDATFLKRYGAEEIPLMLLINGFLTVAFFWLIGACWQKVADSALIAWFLIFSAILAGGLFLMVTGGHRMAYPVLYQLLNLQDSFFLVYLWNVAGDLFDARQGKRIFPLIMAGQVLGTTLGSMIVAPLARVAGYDSLLVIVAAAYLLTGIALAGTAARFMPPTGPQKNISREINRSYGEIMALVREYPLVRYLIANAFFPNILLPVFTYQFALIAQGTFPTEQALLTFLGVFRGAASLIIFLLMFVMGRFYVKIGLTRAFFFHPLNFAALFAGLACSFNIFIAAYGQFSTLLIQRAIAGPINKILFNLTPERIMKWSRVFVGGTVIKASIIISALGMVILKRFFPASDLAILAAAIALWWIYETFLFRRRFTGGLKQTLADQAIDYEKIEAEQTMVHDLPYMEAHRPLLAGRKEEGRSDEALAANPEGAMQLLASPDANTRARAAGSFAANRDIRAFNLLIEKLADTEAVRRAAIDSLSRYGTDFHPFLETALINAPWQTKTGIIEVLRLSGKAGIPYTFIGEELKRMYQHLEILEVLSRERPTDGVMLLAAHLREDHEAALRMVFQTLRIGVADTRLIYESLGTPRAAVAIELLESLLPAELNEYLLPLIENAAAAEKIKKGEDLLIFCPAGLPAALSFLGESADPTTRMLAAYAIGAREPEMLYYPTAEKLLKDPEENVRQTAAYAMKKIAGGEAYMPEIILNMTVLQKTPLFEGMSMRTLEAIAAVVKQMFYKAGDIVIREGGAVSSLHCIISGRIDACRHYGEPDEHTVRTLTEGSIFGEISLFTGHPAGETCVVASDFVELYIIDHEYVRELMNIHPQIGVSMGRYFALQLEGAGKG